MRKVVPFVFLCVASQCQPKEGPVRSSFGCATSTRQAQAPVLLYELAGNGMLTLCSSLPCAEPCPPRNVGQDFTRSRLGLTQQEL